MSTRYSVLVVGAALVLVLTSCGAVPRRPVGETGIVFDAPISQVRTAAVDALLVYGFDLKKQEDNYLEGSRPRKIGLLVGSGGEAIGVWLEEQGQSKTYVEASTAKSFVGYVGQKDWSTLVLAEIQSLLQ